MTTRKPRIRKPAAPDRSDMVPAIQKTAVTRTMLAADGKTRLTVVLRAPIATRAEWDDPEDTNTSGARTARQASGYRRTDPLRLLHRRGEHVTKQMLQDAERYRDDFEIGALGAKFGGGLSIGIGGTSGGFSDRQAMAMARYRAANEAVGREAEAVLGDIVLGLMDLTTWAAAQGVSRQHATGLLVAAMQRLREHYETLDQATLRRQKARNISLTR